MKKIIAMFFLFLGLIILTSCLNADSYKLTIIDTEDFIYDKPKEKNSNYDAGVKITLHCHPIMDADLAMYVDGEFYSKQNCIETDDGYIWEYTFTMPSKDTVVEFKIDGGK